MRLCIVLALVLILASSAFALEKKAYQMKEDFGTEPLYDGALNYYYYIPTPTSSWFWAFTGWSPGELIGTCFTIGDYGWGGWDALDPATCHSLEVIQILDFAGYGTVYPGKFTIEFDVYCAEDPCCGTAAPVTHLWNSGPFETGFAWNYCYVDPPLCLTDCGQIGPKFVVTATMTGTDGIYPAFGMDNISTPIEQGYPDLIERNGLPCPYPRFACSAGDPMVHSGYIGTFPFQYWPPLAFLDGDDTTEDGSQFGAIELAWRVYIICGGPTATEPSSWGNIKSMYR
jgi:hypothetical protein